MPQGNEKVEIPAECVISEKARNAEKFIAAQAAGKISAGVASQIPIPNPLIKAPIVFVAKHAGQAGAAALVGMNADRREAECANTVRKNEEAKKQKEAEKRAAALASHLQAQQHDRIKREEADKQRRAQEEAHRKQQEKRRSQQEAANRGRQIEEQQKQAQRRQEEDRRKAVEQEAQKRKAKEQERQREEQLKQQKKQEEDRRIAEARKQAEAAKQADAIKRQELARQRIAMKNDPFVPSAFKVDTSLRAMKGMNGIYHFGHNANLRARL
jgi:DNA repair exonuclease SbcCD ATPase subunit